MDAAPPPLPPLGAAVRGEWTLDPAWLTVNHGSFGATPRAVQAAQALWRGRMEAQPSRFMRAVLPGALRAAADRLAAFLGAEGRDLAFVENATVGCNAVLRSLPFAPGDEILSLAHVYGAVRNAILFVAARTGARPVEAAVPFPRPDADGVLAALSAALSPRTRLAVLDHVTSASALALPVARMVAACRAAGVPVLVDGAHAPGQLDLDLAALDADWYVGNCHKWLMAPKGCAFLWARRDRQDGLHPVTVSHGLGGGFLEEFDWTGTRDPTAFLAIDEALAFHERLGGPLLRRRNRALALEATARLARRLGTEAGADAAMTGSMGLVRLPLAGPLPPARVLALRDRLLRAGTDAPLFEQAGALWVRLSAQAYNEPSDYDRLAAVLEALVAGAA